MSLRGSGILATRRFGILAIMLATFSPIAATGAGMELRRRGPQLRLSPARNPHGKFRSKIISL
jgi:hypothetical protein